MKISNLNISNKGIFFVDKNNNQLQLKDSLTKIINRFKSIFLDIELFILWFVGYIPSHTIRKILYRICGMTIGKKSTFHMGARFFNPKNISVGEGTIIGDHIFIDGRARVSVGNHTDIASQVMIYNSEHDLSDPNFVAIEEEVTIGDYCFIGPRSIIMPGVKIGDGAVVAGGAVVTRDVVANTVVGGVPAKLISERPTKKHNYRLGRPRLFQ